MGKKYYKNLKMIVCVGKDNLIGDRTPDENSNGMLWHIKEELMYFKSKTVGNTVLFGGTTAKYVPIEFMKKNREVIVLHRNMDVPKLIEDLTLEGLKKGEYRTLTIHEVKRLINKAKNGEK